MENTDLIVAVVQDFHYQMGLPVNATQMVSIIVVLNGATVDLRIWKAIMIIAVEVSTTEKIKNNIEKQCSANYRCI